MKKEEYKAFVERNLNFFRNRYKISKNKRELKRAVFDSHKLNEMQKEDFWNLITENVEVQYEV